MGHSQNVNCNGNGNISYIMSLHSTLMFSSFKFILIRKKIMFFWNSNFDGDRSLCRNDNFLLVWFSVICKSFFDKINEKAIYQCLSFHKILSWSFFRIVDSYSSMFCQYETLQVNLWSLVVSVYHNFLRFDIYCSWLYLVF